jgi:RHS repeat-associated protein
MRTGNTSAVYNGGSNYNLFYDVENRVSVVQAVGTGQDVASYFYDAQNRRIWSWGGATDGYGNTTNYTVNVYTPGGQKLAAYTLSTVVYGSSYTPGLNVTLSSSDTYFGSRRLAVMDQLGSAVNSTSQSYFPWGETKGTSNPQDTWNFGTYWQDSATGLDYAMNRYYSNAYGRFMTPDPSGSSDANNPQSWNQFAYVIGDPVNSNDPDGLVPIDLYHPRPLPESNGALGGSTTRTTPPSPDQQTPSRPTPHRPDHILPDPFTVQFVGATSAANYPYLIACGGAPYGAFTTETFQIDENGQPLSVAGLTVEELITNSVSYVGGTAYPGGDSGLWTPTTIPGPTTTNANGQFIDSPFGGCGGLPAELTFNQTYRVKYNGRWYFLTPTFSFTWILGLGNITVTSTSGINFTVSR